MRKTSVMIAAVLALAAATPHDASAQRRGVASYDWYFVTHGGSGDLIFGDGDWAEGASLLSLYCLPSSGTVALSGDNVTLRAGGHSLTSSTDAPISVDNPVLQALRSTGTVRMTSGRTSRTLMARAAGRGELRRFMLYCGAARR